MTTGPAFRFRLERVRAVRERNEKLAKQELAEALSRRASTEAELLAADAQLERAQAEHRAIAAEVETLGATELLARQLFLERVEEQRGARVGELRARDAEVAERDAKLVVAASEHEMLNRLKERRRGEHDRELAGRERDALDEIATVRHGRDSR